MTIVEPCISGIGSLPHHNIDAALEYSFRHDLPFLPQIPKRNPWEFMIAQALEGLPGLQVESDGGVHLDVDVWSGRSYAYGERLKAAFAAAPNSPFAFEAFEPSAATCSGWQPFLWELEERKAPRAKVQIAGPLTCQWALRADGNSPIEKFPELANQVYQLVLARAISMVRRLCENHVHPTFFLDEPGLYALTLNNPRHRMALQELGLMIDALRKNGASVGIHCCSNTDWDSVLALNPDLLSLDTGISLKPLLERGASLTRFLTKGGRLSFGVIPTALGESDHPNYSVNSHLSELIEGLSSALDNPDLVHRALKFGMYTPACGLALHTPESAESIQEHLMEFRSAVRSTIARIER